MNNDKRKTKFFFKNFQKNRNHTIILRNNINHEINPKIVCYKNSVKKEKNIK